MQNEINQLLKKIANENKSVLEPCVCPPGLNENKSVLEPCVCFSDLGGDVNPYPKPYSALNDPNWYGHCTEVQRSDK